MRSHSNNEIGPTGRVDIHSHLIPGIDDGCVDVTESIQCIRRLHSAGFVGSFCTPHMWPQLYPKTTPELVSELTAQLQSQVQRAGLEYGLWPGAELRLFDGVVDWLQTHGVPVLGSSSAVLVDFWEDNWPSYATPALEWLLDQGYRPILAHPERLNCHDQLKQRLKEVEQMGVWLQGNLRCMTGEDGFMADRLVRQLLQENRYQFLALDAHRQNCLESRLNGMQLVVREFGESTLDQLTQEAPRRYLLDQPA